jgi:hypothetical protein
MYGFQLAQSRMHRPVVNEHGTELLEKLRLCHISDCQLLKCGFFYVLVVCY